MNGTVRKTPVWLIGVAVAAAGMVIATPVAPAFACPGEQALVASGGTAGLLRTAVTSGLTSIQVRGGGPVNVPAGGAAPLTVTVVNTGSRFAGLIELEVRPSDPSGLPALTMELQVDGAQTVTWRRLAEVGTAGRAVVHRARPELPGKGGFDGVPARGSAGGAGQAGVDHRTCPGHRGRGVATAFDATVTNPPRAVTPAATPTVGPLTARHANGRGRGRRRIRGS